jgi:hypothetical protein
VVVVDGIVLVELVVVAVTVVGAPVVEVVVGTVATVVLVDVLVVTVVGAPVVLVVVVGAAVVVVVGASVVLVVGGPVVVVVDDPGQPPAHASQQLVAVPAHTSSPSSSWPPWRGPSSRSNDCLVKSSSSSSLPPWRPPCDARHSEARRIEHRERPWSISQHATTPCRPHVELSAHETIVSRHRFGIRPSRAAFFACRLTQLT